jgi:DNA-binding MarR family transcriptional regulator
MRRPLTARQLEVLEAIARLAAGPRPLPPTVRELARELHRAPSTVVRTLDRLELAGAIVRDGRARGLWVVRPDGG